VQKKGTPLNVARPGHKEEDRAIVACEACHARWSFEDRGLVLSREDDPFFEEWMYLSTQGSSEVESFLKKSGCPEKVSMLDKLTLKPKEGIWFQTFFERRWGPVTLRFDESGRLMPARPILDLSVNYTDRMGKVIYDNLRPKRKDIFLPYTPHTIGKADVFRALSISDWLMNPEKKNINKIINGKP
jgi:hypothetical protein